MPRIVFRQGEFWDVVVSRNSTVSLVPVWLCRDRHRILLCQVQNNRRFGWTVVVSGEVSGLRLVEGFKQRWQAISYALNIRLDLDHHDY